MTTNPLRAACTILPTERKRLRIVVTTHPQLGEDVSINLDDIKKRYEEWLNDYKTPLVIPGCKIDFYEIPLGIDYATQKDK